MKKTRWDKSKIAFMIATVALLVWGILAQILCEVIGETPFLSEYLLHLIPAVGIFFGFYLVGIGTHSRQRLPKLLSWLVVIIMQLSILLVYIGVAYVMEDEIDRYDKHLEREAIHYLLDRAKPIGTGQPIYEYPDSILEGYEADAVGLPNDVFCAFQERKLAEHYFQDYRDCMLLPVLSYSCRSCHK